MISRSRTRHGRSDVAHPALSARLDTTRHRSARLDTTRHRSAWFGSAPPCPARPG
ncbi:hypothetical protein [Streptomyces sp. NPDC126522]|uniref:hypothetical protein n=1 Tax=Streptomyces sp. NPDC126522 TaxID=3155211 RepID=UPI00332E1B26